MKWVVLAIVVFVAGYTLVNLWYRKPGPAFRPYQDMNDRATTVRLLNAGWRKLPAEVSRPTEKPGPGLHASVTRGAPGLGAELAAAFAEPPVLAAAADRATAPDQVARGEPYRVHFNARLADQHLQLDRVEALVRGTELVLIPTLERLPGRELLSRWADADYLATVPTDRLEPGRYTVRLATRGPALEWTLEVR
jgi:hypothetical protein